MVLFFLGLINGIIQILTRDRLVGRDLHNVHAVNITELLLLGKRRTGHTALFIIFIKEILEGNVGKSHTLSLDLHMFLCLDRLMQTIRITTPRHDTSGKTVYDQNLIVGYDIILIAEHKVVGAQCQNDVVLQFQIFRVR